MKELIHTSGGRKRARTRVFITKTDQKGSVNIKIKITSKKHIDYKDYFRDILLQYKFLYPLEVLKDLLESVGLDILVDLEGGGKSGQAGGAAHALAKALQILNPEYRALLKPTGLLSRDSRKTERKKYGQPGARKKFQFSKR